MTYPRPSRYAVTLMEVVFAIGIVLAGLVGLAALIPIAASNAKATVEMDRSINESTSAETIAVLKQMIDLDSLVIYDKLAIDTQPNQALGIVPEQNAISVRYKTENQGVQVNGGLTTIYFGKLESPGYGHHPFGSGLTSAICVDPLGMPNPTFLPSEKYDGAFRLPIDHTQPNPDNVFDYSRFPYFSEMSAVLAPPNENVTQAGGAPFLTPRMWRATLAWDLQNDGIKPVNRNEVIPHSVAQRLFRGFGDVSVLNGNEDGDPGSVLVSQTKIGVATQLFDASRDESSRYSWFLTLVPPFLGGNNFRQSFVVVDRRLPMVPRRQGDPAALNQTHHVIEDAKDNPDSEVLTWVGGAIGFADGTGGDVLLYGSDKVSSDVRVGEWVLLSRQPYAAPPPNPTGPAPPPVPTGPPVHRWFQVLSVDEPEFGLINSTFAEANWTGRDYPVWRRWVTLRGSDWAFGLGVNNLLDDTYCTIVKGAISVVESTVVIE